MKKFSNEKVKIPHTVKLISLIYLTSLFGLMKKMWFIESSYSNLSNIDARKFQKLFSEKIKVKGFQINLKLVK